MKLTLSLAIALVAIGAQSIIPEVNAGTSEIIALDVRANGIFGHDPNVSDITINGAAPAGTVVADPLNIALTYSNLDLDEDGTANDAVTFTLKAEKNGMEGGNLRVFNQGIDTGFGNLSDTMVTVTDVSGTTSDMGMEIVFDGFIGAAVGFGGNGDLISSAEINGQPVNVNSPSTGAFQFVIADIDFDATPSVTFDNSVRDGIGTIVARHYDLQFSTVPEPSALVVILLGCAGLYGLRRTI